MELPAYVTAVEEPARLWLKEYSLFAIVEALFHHDHVVNETRKLNTLIRCRKFFCISQNKISFILSYCNSIFLDVSHNFIMTALEFVKSKWQYLIFVAILTHIALNWTSNFESNNTDLVSAIKRAKTQSCKTELRDIASYLEISEKSQKSLYRSCPLDSKIKVRTHKLGCTSKRTRQLTKLDYQVQDSSTCHNLCFSYGHSYGGYDDQSKICYCGDKDMNFSVIACDRLDKLELFKVNDGIYYVNQTFLPGDFDSRPGSIKIAFLLILTGQNARQVKRLIKNIYSETHIYYLHVDGRNDKLLQELHHALKGWKNIFFASSRYRTIWGGTSMLPMTINAISYLYHYDWDFLINLSESDFPIKSLIALESYLGGHSKSSIYLKSHNIKGYKFIKKQGLDRNFYQCEDRVWRIGRRQLPLGIVYSGGSDWYALPRQFCTYILIQSENPSSLVNALVQLFNFTLLPVESFFHTLAHNSEFCDKVVDNNLRITNWNRKKGCKCQHKDIVDWCGCSPLVYRSFDWSKLLQTNRSDGLFFTRKFDPTISSSIINLVEQKLVRSLDDSGEIYDTRYWQNLHRLDDSMKIHHGYEVFKQFGMFCLNQTKFLFHSEMDLKSVDLFYNHDRFVGYILYYCSKTDKCVKLLVVRKTEYHPDNYTDNRCFELDGRSLSTLEVNQGFDVGERMFRDHQPLNHLSDVVVYHDWIVGMKRTTNGTNPGNQLIFSWINPKGKVRLSQSIKFKDVSEPTRLSLAHRLNISKPIEAGVWSLTIYRFEDQCSKHLFISFDSDSFDEKKIIQDEFNKFYSVKSICREKKTDEYWSEMSMCFNQYWNFIE